MAGIKQLVINMKKIGLLLFFFFASLHGGLEDQQLTMIREEMNDLCIEICSNLGDSNECAAMIQRKIIAIAKMHSWWVRKEEVVLTESQKKRLGTLITQIVTDMVSTWKDQSKQWMNVLEKFVANNKKTSESFEDVFVYIYGKVFAIIFRCTLNEDCVNPKNPQVVFENVVRDVCHNNYRVFTLIVDLLKYTCQNLKPLVIAYEDFILIDKQGNRFKNEFLSKVYSNQNAYFENLDDKNQWEKAKEVNLTTSKSSLNNTNELQLKIYTNLKIAGAGVGLIAINSGLSQFQEIKKGAPFKEYAKPVIFCGGGLAILGGALWLLSN